MYVYIERPWNEALSSKIAEVQDSFKNIPSMLYFSPSSVTFDGIGVYAAETLPKGMIRTFSVFIKKINLHLSLLYMLRPYSHNSEAYNYNCYHGL